MGVEHRFDPAQRRADKLGQLFPVEVPISFKLSGKRSAIAVLEVGTRVPDDEPSTADT